MTSPPSLKTLGKRWGLRRLADARGHFLMLATDQRPPIVHLIARLRGCAPEAVTFAEVAAVKIEAGLRRADNRERIAFAKNCHARTA